MLRCRRTVTLREDRGIVGRKAAVRAVRDQQPREQPLRLRFGIAVALPAAVGPFLAHFGEPIRRQRRIGEHAREQAGRGGEFRGGAVTAPG